MEDMFVVIFMLFGVVVFFIVLIILYLRKQKDNKQKGHRSKSIFKSGHKHKHKHRSSKHGKRSSLETNIKNTMKVDFEKYADGLAPCVVQDNNTKTVLMVGFMNLAALQQTQMENKVTFFSRSKQRLWTKGEKSGNFLFVKEILADCDNDTILIKAEPVGPVCHTGADTCFGEVNKHGVQLATGSIASTGHLEFLDILEKTIEQRKNNPTDKSYTASLFAKGINKIAQKVGEEAVEVVIEAKDSNTDLFKGEAADLLFHYLVLLQAKGIMLNDVVDVLKQRNKS